MTAGWISSCFRGHASMAILRTPPTACIRIIAMAASRTYGKIRLAGCWLGLRCFDRRLRQRRIRRYFLYLFRTKPALSQQWGWNLYRRDEGCRAVEWAAALGRWMRISRL